MHYEVHLVSVFGDGPGGGNMAPIVANAAGMSDADMQEVARKYGHESGYVLPPPADSGCDYAFRFWVPNHEMEMCGHATVGAVWLLNKLGKLSKSQLSIWTLKGPVQAHVLQQNTDSTHVEITQPQGQIESLPNSAISEAGILSILGISRDDLAPHPIQNACTSRVKTLIPVKSVSVLNSIKPDFHRINQDIGSTGLYPYAKADEGSQIFEARQFPKSSGYPEDAATGIAAAALSFGLLANGLVSCNTKLVKVRQGCAMGKPSQIEIRFIIDDEGCATSCWLGGNVQFEQDA